MEHKPTTPAADAATLQVVTAAEVRPGDVIRHEHIGDATVTAVSGSPMRVGGRLTEGLAIDAENGTRRVRMFRKGTDTVDRVRTQR